MARRKIDAKYLQGIDTVDQVFRELTVGKDTGAGARVAGRTAVKRIAWALNKGAEEIADRARQIVPKDDLDTYRSIDHEIVRIDRETSAGERPSAAAIVFAGGRKAPGAWRSEFGRAPGGDGANADHPGHIAQPFMFPSYHSIRPRVTRRVAREIKRLAKEIAARHGR